MKKLFVTFLISALLAINAFAVTCVDAGTADVQGGVISSVTQSGIAGAKVTLQGCLSSQVCQFGIETITIPVYGQGWFIETGVCVGTTMFLTAEAPGFYPETIGFNHNGSPDYHEITLTPIPK